MKILCPKVKRRKWASPTHGSASRPIGPLEKTMRLQGYLMHIRPRPLHSALTAMLTIPAGRMAPQQPRSLPHGSRWRLPHWGKLTRERTSHIPIYTLTPEELLSLNIMVLIYPRLKMVSKEQGNQLSLCLLYLLRGVNLISVP